MASLKPVRFGPCLGLNTVSAPQSLVFDMETGKWEASKAVNVWLDLAGGSALRPGYFKVGSVGLCSIWSDDAQAYGVGYDGTLYRFNRDLTLTSIKTGLIPGASVRFTKAEYRVFWTDGATMGSILDGDAVPWGEDTYPFETVRIISPPPVGQVVEYHAGRIFIACGNLVYWTEHLHDFVCLNESHMPAFRTRVRMLRSVPDGIYVGTEDAVWFVSGTMPDKFTYQQVATFPVIEGTDVAADGSLLGEIGAPAPIAMWTGTRGVCAGLPGGIVRNLTDRKIIIPPATRGTACIIDNKYAVVLDR